MMSAGKSDHQATAPGKYSSLWKAVSLAEVTSECRSRNNGQLDDMLLCGVLKSHGLVPMRERVKGDSTERCKVVAPNAFAYNPMRLNIGSIARNTADHSVMVSPDYVVFQTDPERLLPNYLDHVRHSDLWRGYVGASGDGSVRVRIYYDQLSRLQLPLPPLPEQRKIAAILTAVDDKLEVIARQIAATQTLKQGLMQTLFSCGVGIQNATGSWIPHNEFKDSELGTIPAVWDVGVIADYVSALRSGVSVNAEDRVHGDDEVGVLKVSCVVRGEFYPNCHKAVLPEERERVAEPVLQGRIIVSRANTPALVGESAYVDSAWPNLFLPDKLWQIEPSDRSHSVQWLAFYLQSPFVRQEISKAATGTSGSMKNIAKPAFLGIRMPLVPLAEQEHIAAILSGVTSKIEALSRKQGHFRTLKLGLMQKLLTGEWRVKLDSAANNA
ncbi:restriction endonuclease subunit S [Pseudomonas syringae pv. actinidiae]|uniref:Restriction endonuclease S subunit n=2 Tax=Pseudomonas syringae group TaxID=136849 RepID=A0AAN4TI90_PSESF|nr:restriction endonuclease subunit S [Pseudomonas syringae]AKT27932.1 restriction endonuclease subunit S [Pseudomonas syringae pv. actinidiae ICMP 18884]AOE54509.1 restriction endonuclease subunit S [Pseudomonas syringae pv. actinidiae ICMP 18708]AYL78553.1 restriction endonuclease subunit S [Pseudomonas syringae pv. actinidiae str. Shaanxi_M228]EPN57428.1 type I restriction-modification system, S subunit, EcoA family protein [Pseudomonas syringae pv. actinidiae ICMP 19079]EPN85627.1 type I r